MLYVLRYAEEMRDPKSALSGIKNAKIETDELSLATQLIHGSTSPFNPSAYKDDYQAAVKKLVDSKRKGKPLPEAEPTQQKSKVVNIMDALRRSLAEGNTPSKIAGRRSRGVRRLRNFV
jgi:DNA end-binding protein Ku